MNDELTRFIADIKALKPIRLDDYRDLFATEFPEILALEKCEQNPRWHAEGNVYLHTQWVMNETIPLMEGLEYEEALVLYLSAMLHDIGKPLRTTINEKGDLTAAGHERAGVHLARTILHKLDLPYRIRHEVLAQVARHYMPYTLVIDRASNQDYFRLSHRLNTRILYLLETADFRGRIGESVGIRLEQIMAFEAICHRLGCFGRPGWPYYMPNLRKKAPRHTIANEIVVRPGHGKFRNFRDRLKYMSMSKGKKFPILYLTIGIPGSGKSTWVDQHLPGIRKISMDQTRRELLGDEADQSQNQRVFELCHRELIECLLKDKSIVFDATSHTEKSRETIISIARFVAWIKIFYFDVPLETALARNANRARRVPEEVIKQFYEELEDPEIYEASQIRVIGENGN